MSGLKPLSDKERLYHEMKTIHDRLGRVLQEYEAVAFSKIRKRKPCLDIIDPATGKAVKFSHRSKTRQGQVRRGKARGG